MIYVNDTGGNDGNTGYNWTYAKKTISNATGAINTNGIMYIADGQYSGTNNTGIIISKNMTINGLSQKGTIIDGNNTNRIFLINSGISLILQNITFTQGSANIGGAIYNNGTLTVSNCAFINNTANTYGGAIYNYDFHSTLNVISTNFTANSGAYYGGAIYNERGFCNITGSEFRGNNAQYGGAIYNERGNLNVTSSTFINNTADDAGAIYNYYATLNVFDSTFTGNTASNGGAIYNYFTGTLTVTNSTFNKNKGQYGGAINNGDYSTCIVTNSAFNSNNATYSGGAIRSKYICDMTGSTFTNNTALYGGGIYIDNGSTSTLTNCSIQNNNATLGHGGGIYNSGSGSSLTIANSNIINNHAIWGGGIYNSGYLTVTGCNIINNSAQYDGGAIYVSSAYATTVNFNRIYNNLGNPGSAISCYYADVDATNNWWGSNADPTSLIYAPITSYASVTVNPWIELIIDTTPNLIKIGENSTVSVSLKFNSNGTDTSSLGAVPDIPILFSATLGTIIPSSIISGGSNTTTYFTPNALGIAIINAILDGFTVNSTVTINKMPTSIIVDNISGTFGSPVNLTATLKDYYNHPLNDKNIQFQIDGNNIGTSITNGNGIASISQNLTESAGTHNITAIFAGDGEYLAISGNGTLSIKIITELATSGINGTIGSSIKLIATLIDKNGNPLYDKNIQFQIDGNTIGSAVTNLKGYTSLNHTITESAGTHNLTAIFAGDDQYLASSDFGLLIVSKLATNMVLNNVNGTIGSLINLTATLTGNGSLENKTIEFWIDGSKISNAFVRAGGIAILGHVISESAGVHNLTAIFAGDDQYLASSDFGLLIVGKIPTQLLVNNITGALGSSVNLTATLIGNGALTGKTILFMINGVNVGNATTYNGFAGVYYALTGSTGIRNITVWFAGDNQYLASSGNALLTVRIAQATLTLITNPDIKNPTIGRIVTYTIKVSNKGPDSGDDVIMTYVIPMGVEFVSATVDVGTYTYYPANRTLIWNLGRVPVGDPYMWLGLQITSPGSFSVNPTLSTSTYDPTINDDTQTITVSAATEENTVQEATENSVNAKTIGMQETGLPIAGLILAILALVGGLIVPKRK